MNDLQQNRNSLVNRLAAYSASAGLLTLTAYMAEGQVMYSGLQNIQMSMPEDIVEVDLNGDMVNDFGFLVRGSLFSTNNGPYFLDRDVRVAAIFNPKTFGYKNSWVIAPGSLIIDIYSYSSDSYRVNPVELVENILPGDAINNSLTNWSNISSLNMNGILGLDVYVSYYGGTFNWAYIHYLAGKFKGNTGFIGIRFYIGSDPHYGWMRVSLGDRINPLRILDWAWQNTPGEGIAAGVGGDNTGPVVSLSGVDPEMTNPSVILSVTMDEQTIGIELSDFLVNNGSASNLVTVTPGRVYTVEIEAESFGEVSVEIPEGAIQDLLGNPNPGQNIHWVYVDPAVGMDITQSIEIRVFPNPADNVLFVESGGPGQVELIDVQGNEVLIQRGNMRYTLHVEDIPPGIYFLKITGGESVNYRQVIIE